MKIIMRINGLDCANCASKLESKINKLPDVLCTLNFMASRMNIEIKNENQILDIEKIIHKFDKNLSFKILKKE